MNPSLLRLLPLATLALALILRIADPAALQSLRLAVFDEFQRLKPAAYEDAGVRIVDIDDESLARVGQWPWPRTELARLLARLADAGVAAIAFDIVFAEPDRTSPRRLAPLLGEAGGEAALAAALSRLPDHDTIFAAHLKATPSVLGMALTADPGPRPPPVKAGFAEAGGDPRPFLETYRGAVLNLPELEQAAAGIGNFSILPERDGVIRRVPLLAAYASGEGKALLVPSLSVEALRVAQGASTYITRTTGASGETGFGQTTGMTHLRVGRIGVPTDQAGRLWLRDAGFVPARFVPAWKVLAGAAGTETLEGTIVLIGTSAPGLKDIRATPLNPVAAGVEVHARAIEQILTEDFLQRPDWTNGAELLLLLAFGLALVLLLPRWGPAWCAGIAVAAIGIAMAGSWLAFARWGLLLDPLYPSLAVFALYLVSSLLVFLRTEGERRRVRTAFSRYMSPVLVERLAADPSRLRLGGEIRDMTVLFCDIRGFTTLSESLDPQALTRFINRFLTPMTDIILRHGGTIDKYMGDAIMAFWNAPLDDPDHAPHAAAAALEMTGSLKHLNAGWAAEKLNLRGAVAIGIGINTGPCCVGNMGSDQRFDYSVIGDDVNLASRLESQSKTYGVPIVVGEATRARLDGFAALELDLLRVKGKQRPVRVYALLGGRDLAAQTWFRAVGEAQAAMLRAYRAQEWSKAAALVEVCRKADDGRLARLYDLYDERIAGLRHAGLPPDWDGVTIAAEK